MIKRKDMRDGVLNAGFKGTNEIAHFLDTYHEDDPVARIRVKVAVAAVNQYMDQCSSDNGMMGMMMAAAERSGVSADQALEMVKAAGLLPDAIEPSRLKLAK